MIKRCPSCNRTYSDESISFCLADGALLSAPYDSSKDEPPPTEILPPPTRAAVPPTEPAKPVVPTMTRRPEYRPVTLAEADDTAKGRTGLIWVVIAVGALSFVGIGLVVRSAFRDSNEPIAAQTSPSPPMNSAPTPSVSPNDNPNLESVPASTIPVMRNSPSPEKSADMTKADPVLFPTNSRQLATPTPASAGDAAKIYNPREVDQRVQIVSRPKPSYTEEARKNQIAGVVVLRAVFSASGQVTNIHAVSGLPNGLTEQAIAAAKQIKFVPATKDGRPVSTWMQLQYDFNLY